MHDDHVAVRKVVSLQSAQPRAELWLLQSDLLIAGFGHSERIFNSTDKFIVVDITSSHNVDILAHIVSVVVLFNHASADGFHVPDVPKDGEPNLLIFKDSSMRYFDGRLQGH